MTEIQDWRQAMLDDVRALIREAVPDVSETRKWAKAGRPDGVPVWDKNGIICTGEVYKDKVKLTFAKGAAVADPAGLFNASLTGSTRRAIDIGETDRIDPAAFRALVKAAAAANAKPDKRR